jgi:hypothetical protein
MASEIEQEEDTHRLEAQLIAKIRQKDGHAGNVALRRELGWEDNRYWAIRDSGCIRTMRGDPGFRQWVLYLVSIFDSSSLCREAKFLVRLADCAMLSSAPLSSPA